MRGGIRTVWSCSVSPGDGCLDLIGIFGFGGVFP